MSVCIVICRMCHLYLFAASLYLPALWCRLRSQPSSGFDVQRFSALSEGCCEAGVRLIVSATFLQPRRIDEPRSGKLRISNRPHPWIEDARHQNARSIRSASILLLRLPEQPKQQRPSLCSLRGISHQTRGAAAAHAALYLK